MAQCSVAQCSVTQCSVAQCSVTQCSVAQLFNTTMFNATIFNGTHSRAMVCYDTGQEYDAWMLSFVACRRVHVLLF